MPRNWKVARHWLWISALCAGCAAQSPLVVTESTPTMIEIYRRHMLPESTSNPVQQRHEDRIKGVTATPTATNRTRIPVIHMYVFPHRSKADSLWIPGYWTSFELYERVETGADRSED